MHFVQGVADISGEVCAQAQADGQAAAAVALPHSARHSHIPEHMDAVDASQGHLP